MFTRIRVDWRLTRMRFLGLCGKMFPACDSLAFTMSLPAMARAAPETQPRHKLRKIIARFYPCSPASHRPDMLRPPLPYLANLLLPPRYLPRQPLIPPHFLLRLFVSQRGVALRALLL